VRRALEKCCREEFSKGGGGERGIPSTISAPKKESRKKRSGARAWRGGIYRSGIVGEHAVKSVERRGDRGRREICKTKIRKASKEKEMEPRKYLKGK